MNKNNCKKNLILLDNCLLIWNNSWRYQNKYTTNNYKTMMMKIIQINKECKLNKKGNIKMN